MPAVVFDTLAAARRMEDAGMERDHAAAVAEAVRDAAEGAAAAAVMDRDTLATKADLQAGLATLETRLTGRMVTIAPAVNGALAVVLGGLLVAVLDRLP